MQRYSITREGSIMDEQGVRFGGVSRLASRGWAAVTTVDGELRAAVGETRAEAVRKLTARYAEGSLRSDA